MIFVNSTAYSIQYTAVQHTAYSIQHTVYSIAWGTLTIAKRYLSMRHTVYSCEHTAYSIQHIQHTAYQYRIMRAARRMHSVFFLIHARRIFFGWSTFTAVCLSLVTINSRSSYQQIQYLLGTGTRYCSTVLTADWYWYHPCSCALCGLPKVYSWIPTVYLNSELRFPVFTQAGCLLKSKRTVVCLLELRVCEIYLSLYWRRNDGRGSVFYFTCMLCAKMYVHYKKQNDCAQ